MPVDNRSPAAFHGRWQGVAQPPWPGADFPGNNRDVFDETFLVASDVAFPPVATVLLEAKH